MPDPRPNPATPASPVDRAVALHQAGRPDQAEALLRRVLAAGPPRDPRVLGVMASVLAVQGKHEQATHYFDRAFAAGIETPALRTNLGNILLLGGRPADARPHFERAITLDEAFAPAWLGLAPALHQLGDAEGAVAAARRARDLAPGDSSAALNLASALVGIGHVEEALAISSRALDLDPANVKLITNYLMSLHYAWGRDPAQVFAEHRRLGARLAPPASAPRAPAFTLDRDPERPLRVGYLSSDLRHHVVAVFVRGMLERRDRSRFGAIAYSVSPPDDESARLRPLFDRWVDAYALSDDALAQRIRADRLDILVDLNGHTEGSRVALVARRLAPIQVTAIGYPDTTGVPEIDWRLVDAVTDPPPPPGGRDLATERLWRLPGCFLCYWPPAPPAEAPAVSPVPPITRAGAPTFGCFNAAPKISPPLLRLWGRLLARVPGSRLMLKNRALSSASRREAVTAEIAAGLREAGGDAAGLADRLDLRSWSANFAAHLDLYNRVDAALDSFPYHGTTTTCESLWMGVPVVTLAGPSHVSRVGASLLAAAGLPDLVADDEEGYLRLAADLSRNAARLADLRRHLRERVSRSRLCDTAAHARAVEAAYRAMWHDYLERTTPATTR